MRAGQLPIQQQLAHLRAAWRRNRTLTDVLARAAGMDLPGWYLVAGCLYQTVWNVVTGQPPEAGILDYDLAYFDDSDLSWDAEDAVIKAGNEIFAGLPAPVQIRNQARVHLWYEQKFGVPCPPHASTEAAIDTFEATAACLGAGRGPSGRWRIYAPYGLADMFNLVVRPNPVLAPRHVYQAKAARWRQQWPGLTVLPWPEPRPAPASAPGTTPRAVSSPRRPCAAWAHQPGSVASRPSQGSSLGASFDLVLHGAVLAADEVGAGAAEQRGHGRVVGRDQRGEAVDAFGAGAAGQLGQQFGAQPAALPVVGDGDGDLGCLRVAGVADVAGDADAAPAGAVQRAERLVVVVVDVGEVAQFGR